VSGIVKKTGLLQPTASMAVGSLEEKAMVERRPIGDADPEDGLATGSGAVGAEIVLTESGVRRADEIADRVGKIVVRRRRRGMRAAS
jgi:hypothetical protein